MLLRLPPRLDQGVDAGLVARVCLLSHALQRFAHCGRLLGLGGCPVTALALLRDAAPDRRGGGGRSRLHECRAAGGAVLQARSRDVGGGALLGLGLHALRQLKVLARVGAVGALLHAAAEVGHAHEVAVPAVCPVRHRSGRVRRREERGAGKGGDAAART